MSSFANGSNAGVGLVATICGSFALAPSQLGTPDIRKIDASRSLGLFSQHSHPNGEHRCLDVGVDCRFVVDAISFDLVMVAVSVQRGRIGGSSGAAFAST
nr:hypothetical protein [uncultured Limnohabitans sp.]